MHSSVPIGKRPEFKQTKSAGWSWPRLVPIHEQHSQSQASQSSASPSLHDHSERQEPPATMISTMISKFHAEADAPLSPVLSADGSVPTAAGGSSAGTIQDQPSNFPRNNSMPSIRELESKEMRAAKSLSTRSSIEFEADIKHPGSAYEPSEDAAEISASASRDGPIEDIAKQDDSELPQVHEDTSMDFPLKCDALFDLLTSPLKQSLTPRSTRTCLRHPLQHRCRLSWTESPVRPARSLIMRHQRSWSTNLASHRKGRTHLRARLMRFLRMNAKVCLRKAILRPLTLLKTAM